MLHTLCSNVKYFTSGFIKGAWELKEHWRKKACLDARSVKVSVITDSLNSTQVHVGEDTFEAVSTFQYLGDVTGESGGCIDANSARITAAWKDFRQLLRIITNRGISLKHSSDPFPPF